MSHSTPAASSDALRILEELRSEARSAYFCCGPSGEASDLTGALSAEALDDLRLHIDRHLLELQKLARTDEMMPIDLAESIVSGLHALLDALEGFSANQQTAILAAALYFVSDDDEIPDTESILGLDDDAAIFNHVMVMVGRSDLTVDL